MIEAVTFDFWQTLMLDTPENLRRGRALRLEGLGKALAAAGLGRSPEALGAAHEASGERLAVLWRGRGEAGTREQVEIFLECLDPALPRGLAEDAWRTLEEAYATPALAFPPAPRDGAADALWALRERGVRIGLISNTGRTPGRILRVLLQRAALLEHFEALTFSDEAGVRKPDPRVFRWTLNKLGARPERAAHVGDDLEADVGGAQGAGLRGIHLANGPGPGSGSPDATIAGFADLVPTLERYGLPAPR